MCVVSLRIIIFIVEGASGIGKYFLPKFKNASWVPVVPGTEICAGSSNLASW